MKIGVIIDSFRKDFLSSIKEAKSIGADGVQIGARFLTNKKDELAGNPVSESRVVSVKEAKKMLSDVGADVFVLGSSGIYRGDMKANIGTFREALAN